MQSLELISFLHLCCGYVHVSQHVVQQCLYISNKIMVVGVQSHLPSSSLSLSTCAVTAMCLLRPSVKASKSLYTREMYDWEFIVESNKWHSTGECGECE